MTRSLPALVALLLAAAPAEALWVGLTPEQIDRALAHGKTTFEEWNKARKPIDNMDPEYVVDLGPDSGSAILYTEFSTLALETRRWLAIQQELKPAEIQRILGNQRGKLVFFVILVGPDRDFLRHRTVRLDQRDQRYQPAFSDVFRGSPTPGAPGRFQAGGQYTFRLADLDAAAPVTLVVGDPDGVELRFEFDLARLR